MFCSFSHRIMASTTLLSVIIPCYNLGHFLPDAIRSCLSIPQFTPEIIVVDDGSSDDTEAVTARFSQVCYHYQPNSGLAAARNAGLSIANGEFICFLDADDWLIPENIHYSVNILREQQDLAFVFGRHLVQAGNGRLHPHCPEVRPPYYPALLTGNHIGNPSTVVYRRSVVRYFPFSSDPSFRGCEDYQQYLRIVRSYLVAHHEHPVAVYRRHNANMSNNRAMMLHSILHVLETQKQQLRHPGERKAWEQGREAWLQYYSYFPLRVGQKLQINRYHWKLLRLVGWGLPGLLIRKWVRIS
jgi:glycosyltransferase involved in cell wall biosynthesis